MTGHKQFLVYLTAGLFGFLPLSGALGQDSGSNNSVTDLADRPLYLAGGRGVPGNLVLTPSVEYPTIQSLANIDGSYGENTEYVGYFDSAKCYEYSYSTTESERHFFPTSSVGSSFSCSGVDEWSGNFLNWVTTQTIDPFRKALTGGYRVKDTATETWLEKARHPGQSNIAERSVSGSTLASVTPFTDTLDIKIEGMGTSFQFYLGSRADGFESLNSTDLKAYNPDNFPFDDGDSGSGNNSKYAYLAAVRVKVCDASVGLEDNCVQYDSASKPEGLIQKNVETLRYSVFSYLNHGNTLRDGGVLRADQRDVSSEWDPDTGVIFTNPDGASEGNSGVINYINKFGQLGTGNQKVYDSVSELYYTATRYLKGMDEVSAYSADLTDALKDGFPVITNWNRDELLNEESIDPYKYECQASAILGIGDTNTWKDKNLPGNTAYLSGEPSKPSEVSSDDTVNVVEMTNLVGAMEGLGDIGSQNSFGRSGISHHETSAYIAGLAYDNRVNDIRPDLPGDQLVSTHWVDVMEGEVLRCPGENQYYLATKYGGFRMPDDYDTSRTDALPEDWWTTGDDLQCVDGTVKKPENFYTADNASNMVESLGRAFDSIVTDAIGTSTGVTFNTATIESDTLLFGAQFNSADWTGNLFATAIERSASGAPTIADDYTWEAGEVLDQRDLSADPRNIYTYNSGSGGLEFIASNLTSFTQQMQDDLAFGGNTEVAENRISYLRGNTVTGYRVRGSLLGDIVNSTPVYIEEASMGWPESEAFGVDDERYSLFAFAQSDRKGVIYVGANDGMLHAFDAENGEELFAYIPEFVASATDQEGLHDLTDPNYSHRYYVDLTPVVSEVNTQGAGNTAKAWRSVLIGGARTGAKGIFALDVTDPTGFDNGASDIPMWEFTAEDDGRLGYITEPPTIALAQWGNNDYRWTAFLQNGYQSATPSTGFFMLDIEGGLDGTWTESTDYMYVEFEGGTDSDASGLSPIRQVDLEGNDKVVDRIYAGDLKGNVWVASYGNQGWASAYGNNQSSTPLFTATDGTNPQPITVAPLAFRYPDEEAETDSAQRIMLAFGTGKYLELSDVNDTAVQSFYGVFDQVGGLGRSDLLGRTLTNDQVTSEGITYDVRFSTGETFDSTSYDGWYVDLIDSGERITLPAQIRDGYLFVNSLVPTTNPCDIGGGGWLMAFGLDGRTPDRTIWPKVGEPVVGFKITGGIPNQTSFIDDYALTPLSNSEILPDEIDTGGSSSDLGRRSWQELYD